MCMYYPRKSYVSDYGAMDIGYSSLHSARTIDRI